jgi:hypothetical protein
VVSLRDGELPKIIADVGITSEDDCASEAPGAAVVFSEVFYKPAGAAMEILPFEQYGATCTRNSKLRLLKTTRDDAQQVMLAWMQNPEEPGTATAANNSHTSTPLDLSVLSGTKYAVSSERCGNLATRATEIDNGSTVDAGKSGERIRVERISDSNRDWIDLIDCFRANPNTAPKLPIMYGFGEFRSPIHTGMTLQELANALPVMSNNTFKTYWSFDPDDEPKDNPHRLDWVEEVCQPEQVAKEKMGCGFSKPLTRLPGFRRLVHNTSPDYLLVDADGTSPDAKVLVWNLTTSVPVDAYQTTDAVIRYIRQEDLRSIGPPDMAGSDSATWYFSRPQPIGEAVYSLALSVKREGGAFTITLTASDLHADGMESAPTQ